MAMIYEHVEVAKDDGYYKIGSRSRIIVPGQVILRFCPLSTADPDFKMRDAYDFALWALQVHKVLSEVREMIISHLFTLDCKASIDFEKVTSLDDYPEETHEGLGLLLAWNKLPYLDVYPDMKDLSIFKKAIRQTTKVLKLAVDVKQLQIHAFKIKSHYYRDVTNRTVFDIRYLPKLKKSCCPNVEICIREKLDKEGRNTSEVEIVSLRRIFPGEYLYYNRMLFPFEDVTKRQEEQLLSFGAVCECNYCDKQLRKKIAPNGDDIKHLVDEWTTTMLLGHGVQIALVLSPEECGWCFMCGTNKFDPLRKIEICQCKRTMYCSQKCLQEHWQLNHFSDCLASKLQKESPERKKKKNLIVKKKQK